MIYSKILGTGGYLPARVLTNADLEKMMDTSHEWIVERTGIHQRHIAAENESAGSMGVMAAQRALEAAGIDKSEIGMVIVATATPDRQFPSTAVLIQHQLGLNGSAAFDVSAACGGFLYALTIADQFIRTGHQKKVLIIGTEVLSRICDWTDRTTCILFADGAGAMILGASEEPGILTSHIHADGRHADLLFCDNVITPTPNSGKTKVIMSGNDVFKVAVNTLSRIAQETLDAAGVDHSQIDWLIPHQANIRIIQAVAKKLELPMEKVVVTIDRHGNTSSASVLLALDEAIRDGRVKRGQTVLMEAFGGGFTWGSALVRY